MCASCKDPGYHWCTTGQFEATDNDGVNHPNYYTQRSMEAIEIIECCIEGDDPIQAYLKSNIIKYLLRYKDKNGVEDLKKARWYLDRYIEKEENNE